MKKCHWALLLISSLGLATTHVQCQSLFFTIGTSTVGPTHFTLESSGRFLGIDDNPIMYPFALPNMIVNDGGVWISALRSTKDNLLLLKTVDHHRGGTDFVPGSLEDGDNFVESYPERVKYYVSGITTDSYDALFARCHDGDLRYYRNRATDLRSLGYPLRINLAIEMVALLDERCDGCILMILHRA